MEELLNSQAVVVLGGTFDPVHLGHIQITQSICKLLNINEVHLMPDYQPVHRNEPSATIKQRLEMLNLVSHEYQHLTLDLREINRKGASYSILSVQEIRKEIGSHRPLYFVLGGDAFNSFDHWNRWQEILHYCHLLVASRPGFKTEFSPQLKDYVKRHRCDLDAVKSASGSIVYLNNDLSPESSTRLRELRRANQSISKLVTEEVAHYIKTQNLY